jgi:hypothetical protein
MCFDARVRNGAAQHVIVDLPDPTADHTAVHPGMFAEVRMRSGGEQGFDEAF